MLLYFIISKGNDLHFGGDQHCKLGILLQKIFTKLVAVHKNFLQIAVNMCRFAGVNFGEIASRFIQSFFYLLEAFRRFAAVI